MPPKKAQKRKETEEKEEKGETKEPRGQSPTKRISEDVTRSQLTFDSGEADEDQTMTSVDPLFKARRKTTTTTTTNISSRDQASLLSSSSFDTQFRDLALSSLPSFNVNPPPTTTTTTASLSGAPIQVSPSAYSALTRSLGGEHKLPGQTFAITGPSGQTTTVDTSGLTSLTKDTMALALLGERQLVEFEGDDTVAALVQQQVNSQTYDMQKLRDLVQNMFASGRKLQAQNAALRAQVQGAQQRLLLADQTASDRASQVTVANTQAVGAQSQADAAKDVVDRNIQQLSIETKKRQDAEAAIQQYEADRQKRETGIRLTLESIVAVARPDEFKTRLDPTKVGDLVYYTSEVGKHVIDQTDRVTKALQAEETKSAALKTSYDVLDQEVKKLRSEKKTHTEEEVRWNQDITDLRVELAETKTKLANADARAQGFEQKLDASREETKKATSALDAQLADKVARPGNDSDATKQATADYERELANLRNQLSESQAKGEADTKTKDAQIDAVNAQMSGIRVARDTLLNERNQAVQQKDELLKTNGSLEQQLIEKERKLRELDDVVQQLNRLDPNQPVRPVYQGQRLIQAPPSAYAIQLYVADQNPDLPKQPSPPDVKVPTASIQTPASGKDAKVPTVDTQVPTPSSADVKTATTTQPPQQQTPTPPKLSKDDQDALGMDWKPTGNSPANQMIIPLATAQRDAYQLMLVASGGTFTTDFKKRLTFVDDVLDLDSMCEDRAWSLAIVELMDHKPSKTSFYDPYSPLSKQLENIYLNAQEGSTELLFVLELMYVYNMMKDEDRRPPVRLEHIGRYIEHFVRKPLGQDMPRFSHIPRICDSVDKWLSLLLESAAKAQDPTNMFWWTDSPLALAIGVVYNSNPKLGIEALLSHAKQLRGMYANNQHTYHTLMVSALGNSQLLFAFQEMCGTLWNVNNFRANWKTIMEQPGGALLLDVFMALANTQEFNAQFVGHDIRRKVYAELKILSQNQDVNAYFIAQARTTLARQPIQAILADKQPPPLLLKPDH